MLKYDKELLLTWKKEEKNLEKCQMELNAFEAIKNSMHLKQ
jgi:hypothetical protein